MTIYVIIECDHKGCEASATGPNITTVRKGAKLSGWTFHKDGATFCYKHLSETTVRCAKCGKETDEGGIGRLYPDEGMWRSLDTYCDDCEA